MRPATVTLEADQLSATPAQSQMLAAAHAKDRVVGLDALRGLAALSVVVYHFTQRYEDLYHHPHPLPLYWTHGNFGVQLFFIISGFVILLTLERSRTVTDFAVARFARVMPAFWAAICVTLLVLRGFGLPNGDHGPALRDALWNAVLVRPLKHYQVVDGVYWTLGVEMYFYIHMALLFALGLRRLVIPFLGTIVLIGTLQASFGLFGNGVLWKAFNRGFNVEFYHMFLLGVILYESRRHGWKWFHFPLIGLCLLNGLILKWEAYNGPLYFLIVTCLFAIAYLATHTSFLSRPGRVLVYLGTISYSLYLLHSQIGMVLMGHLYKRGAQPWLAISTAIILSVILASIFTFVIERPSNQRIRAWYKARKASRTNNLRELSRS